MTPRAVVDASAALHLVMDGKNAEPIANRLDEAHLVTAPDLFTCEVANGLWKYVGHGDLTAADAATWLEDALALTSNLVPGRLLVHEAWSPRRPTAIPCTTLRMPSWPAAKGPSSSPWMRGLPSCSTTCVSRCFALAATISPHDKSCMIENRGVDAPGSITNG